MKSIRSLFPIHSGKAIFSVWLVCLPVFLIGQVYNVSRYTTADNLVQSQVMALFQDHQGYLWFGTHGGPCKYDGQNFFAIPKDSLAGNFLTDIWEDQDRNHMYFATRSGLTVFDGTTYQTISLPGGEDPVWCMEPDGNGNLWIGTQSQGIQIINLETRQLIQLEDHNSSPIEDRAILSIARGDNRSFWIGTNQGVFQSSDGHILTPWKEEEIRDEVYDIFVSNSRVYFGTNQGAFLWTRRFLVRFLPTQFGGDDDGVFCFAEDREGQIWMGTRKGVLFLDNEGNVQPLIKLDNSLDFHMRTALTDNEGNIWFGTDGGGARKIVPGVFQPYTVEERMSSNQAKSFLRAPNGDIWISTRDRGINVLRIIGDEYERYRILNEANAGIGGDDICYSFADADGNFWFASYNGSLTMINPITEKKTVYNTDNGLEADASYVVGEDRRFIWVGTDKGLFRLVNGRITGHLTTEQGLGSNVVYSLFYDNAIDRMWVGTSTGLSFSNRQGTFTPFEADSTVIGQTVIALEKDQSDRLWVGSAIGLAYIKNDQAHRIRISSTKGAHTIIGLKTEGDSLLWIATENGVYRMDLLSFDEQEHKGQFVHYTRKDGLPSMECNANALFVDEIEENIWIGTAEGAIRKSVIGNREPDTIPPLVYITEVGVENKTDWRNTESITTDPGGLPIGLELPFTQNRIDFSWIGISLRSPEEVEYQYFLEGLESDWPSSTDRTTQISYPNLDPGKYTFRVRAKKEKIGSWDEAPSASLSFTILPPIYQRWWFILIATILLGFMGYLGYRLFTQRRRQQQEEQKIRDTAEKLQLEHQALYAMMNPHFTFNALNAIKLFIHRQDRKAADKFLSAFAKLVRMNLESTKSDFISLEEELRRLELFMDLAKVRFPEKLEVCEITVDREVEMYDTQIPPMLLQPFVENSIEHGIKPLESGGRIDVIVTQQDEDYLKILIKDNGIGIEASQAAKADRPKDHVSRGMQITKDRLKLFARITGKQYSLDLREMKTDTGESEGTEVEMILPIKYSS